MKERRQSQKNYMGEGEVDLKEVFSTFKRYYKSIFTIALLATMLAFVSAYFTTDIYQSETLMQLAENQKVAKSDFINIDKYSNVEDEMVAFRTERLAKKALKNLNIGTRYFMKKNLKNYELYKASPFIVTFEYLSPRVMEMPIRLIPSTEDHFRLIMEPTLKEKAINTVRSLIAPIPDDEQSIVYDKLHSFGEKIETPWFTITVQQVHEFEESVYYFSMLPNESMTDLIGSNLTVSPSSEKGSIIILNFEDNVPLRAKDILDALTNAYIVEKMESKSKSAERKLHFIDMQLEAIDATIVGSAKDIERFKATNIMVDLKTKAQLTAGKLNDLETQLSEINMNIDVKESILNYIETHKDIKGVNITSALQSGQNAAITSIIDVIQKTIVQRNDLLSSLTEAHPSVIKVNRQLISLRKSLNVAILASLRTLQKRKQSLSDIIKENTSKMQALPGQEQRLARLNRNFMVNEKIYSYLLEKRAETAVTESSTVSDIKIFEFPTVADLPIKPNRAIIIFVGFALGLILGLAQAILRAYLDNTIKSSEDIENLTRLPIYGILPTLKQKVIKLEVFKDTRSPFAESYRVLRTNLQFSQKNKQGNVILVTSTIAGEGKSTIVANLGAIFQLAKYKSIVINMDLRKPSLHHYYEVGNSVGMSTYLSGKHSVEEIIQSSAYRNLDIIASGPIPPNPSELILSDKLNELLDRLKEVYDYIFIDSAPLGLVTDTMHLMQYADRNLIIFRENYARKSFVTDLNNLVEKHDLKHIGIVINSVDMSSGGFRGYGYGYGYGS